MRALQKSTKQGYNLVAHIRTFARYFCAIALNKETDPELKVAFQDLRELKVDVALPFLLELYDDYKESCCCTMTF